jgi:hypothetical protein
MGQFYARLQPLGACPDARLTASFDDFYVGVSNRMKFLAYEAAAVVCSSSAFVSARAGR